MVDWLKIIGLGVVAAVAYGIAHDNVTARVCVEYFTIGHVPIFPTESPTLLAFGWGVIATWWVGFGLGVFLAIVSRVGRNPKLTAADLVKPVGWLLVTMAIVSLVAGLAGYYAADHDWISLGEPFASRIDVNKRTPFLADACAHLAAYASACLGGIVLAIWASARRVDLARKPVSKKES